MKDLVRQIRQAIRGRCSDERGVALIVAAGSMVALISAVALAVDVGMLTVARSEAQSAADGAAMAGASVLIDSPNNNEWAVDEAMEFAAHNKIRGTATSVLEEDVVVDLTARTVGVQVLRTEERGNPLGTFFARIFGVSEVNITAYAKARASNAGRINCLLPMAIPDRWLEAGGPGNDPKAFNPDLGDEYIPWMDTSTDPVIYNHESFTGYSTDDIGYQIVIKSNQGGGEYNDNWYYPWRPHEEMGADDYERNVRTCVNPDVGYSIGEIVDPEPGNMVGPTMAGFRDMIAGDQEAAWNETMACVTDAAYVLSDDASYCRSTSRIRPLPMFDPRYGPGTGLNEFAFSNFVGVFVEKVEGGQVYARFVGYHGSAPASDPGGPSAGPSFKVLQLIE